MNVYASTGFFAAVTLGVMAATQFTAPMQPWISADAHEALLRPATVQPSISDAPLGSLMSRGWRLVWNGTPMLPGRMIVRLTLPVAAAATAGGATTEVLQIGTSTDPAAEASCLTYGLSGANHVKLADRLINGVHFAAFHNSDSGMSQRITADDLRATIGGTCYAVERFRYGVAAGVQASTATLPQASGAQMLDAALMSLRIDASGQAAVPIAPGVSLAPR